MLFYLYHPNIVAQQVDLCIHPPTPLRPEHEALASHLLIWLWSVRLETSSRLFLLSSYSFTRCYCRKYCSATLLHEQIKLWIKIYKYIFIHYVKCVVIVGQFLFQKCLFFPKMPITNQWTKRVDFIKLVRLMINKRQQQQQLSDHLAWVPFGEAHWLGGQ